MKDKNKSDKNSKKENNSDKIGQIDVKKCRRCGRLFKNDGLNPDLCYVCSNLDMDDFEKVRNYLYEYNTATALEISDATGVSVAQIERYLREGRLEIPEGSPIFIKCEKCGTEIRYGRLCTDCSLSLSNAMRIEMNFKDTQTGEKPKKPKYKDAKMYYFNKDN